MKVILLQDVAKVGRKNEVKEVSDGFARNNLFPQKRAMPATNENLAKVKSLQKGKVEAGQKRKESFSVLSEKLSGKKIICFRLSGPGGHLFSGLHGKDLVEILTKEVGQKIDVSWIDLPKPIKILGEYKITLRDGESNFDFILSVEKTK